jgi:hypothetical protein
MKKYLLCLLFILLKRAYAQNNESDTMIVVYEKFNSFRCLKHDNKFLLRRNGVYYLEKRSMCKCLSDTNNIFNSNVIFDKIYFKEIICSNWLKKVTGINMVFMVIIIHIIEMAN